MLRWSLSLFVLAIIAALLGFVVLAGVAAWLAKILLGLFFILFLVSLIIGWRRGGIRP